MKLPTWFFIAVFFGGLGLLTGCATDKRLCRELSYTCADECDGDDCEVPSATAAVPKRGTDAGDGSTGD